MAVRDRADEVFTRAKRRVGIENPSAADDDGNVGIVRGALRAFGQGEVDKFLDALKPDVAWEGPAGNFPGGSKLDGRDKVKEKFVGDCGRTFAEFGFVPETFLDAEDENAVVVMGAFQGDGAEGSSLDAPGVMVWQFSGSEAELVRIYTDSAGFPDVVTEEDLKKQEEEEKKKQEEEAKADSEDEDDDDEKDEESKSESESKDESESKSESKDQTKSESEGESESKSESKSDDDSEAKSESKGDSESKSEDSSS